MRVRIVPIKIFDCLCYPQMQAAAGGYRNFFVQRLANQCVRELEPARLLGRFEYVGLQSFLDRVLETVRKRLVQHASQQLEIERPANQRGAFEYAVGLWRQ